MAERWATVDCYGTLVDWNTGIRSELEQLFGVERGDALLARYHELEPEIQASNPGASYREVLTLLPEHEGAMGALASLMSDEKLGGDAAAILIDVYESQGAFAQLAAALDVSVRFTSDPVERVAECIRDVAFAGIVPW